MKKKGLVLFAAGMSLLVICKFGVLNARPSSSLAAGQSAEATDLAEKQFAQAVTFLKQENFDAAIAAYEKVIRLIPESPIAQDARYWIGQTYFRMGKYDEALAVFKKILQDYPKGSIAPVTELMVARVEREKEVKKAASKRDPALDQKVIVDPETGVEYRKTHILAGKSDVIDYVPSGVFLSPNGKFLLSHKTVIPLEGSEPFELVDGPALRSIWSPDGKKVAFFMDSAIWVIPVSPESGRPTGPARKLLEGRYRFDNPVSWSPDSEKIVFKREDDEHTGNIWVLSIKDGVLTQVTDTPDYEAVPSWSPDGKTITYLKRSPGSSETWAVTPDGREPRKFIEDRGYVHWSPDGRYLVFVTRGASGYDPNLFRLADRRMFPIDPPKGVGQFLSWSSDSKKLLFYHSSYDYSAKLKIVSSKGGPTFELGRDLKLWPYLHQWSPDSQWVLTRGQDTHLWMIPLAGGEAVPVKFDSLQESQLDGAEAALSPDAKKILIAVDRDDGKEDLYVAPFSIEEARTTGPAVEILNGWERIQARWEYSWSSDGDKVAVIHQEDLWILSTEGSKPVRVTKTRDVETLPKWAPHGEMIAYLAGIEDGVQILKVISASTGEIKKTLGRGGYYEYAWSPDGKKLVSVSGGVISITAFPENETTPIVDLDKEGLSMAYGFCWLPDGKKFAFVVQKVQEGPTRIYVSPAEGGRLTELAADDDGLKDWLYPSPDGKWISYNSEGSVKILPESSIWEVKVEDLLKGKR